MKKISLFIVFFIISTATIAQDYAFADSLKQNLAQAKSPSEKIRWLGELSRFYMNLDNALSDSYGNQQIETAELSRDRVLMLKALLSNANRYFSSNGVQVNINKGTQLANKALDLAKSNHLDEYIAWSYITLSSGSRSEGENDKALTYSTLAASISSSLSNDSLKISAFNSIGSVYLNRGEKLLAFRNYLQALNLAEAIHNYEQMKNCYYRMSNFYAELEDYEKSKDYLFKLQKITIEFNRAFDRLNVYRSLGRIYGANKQFAIATQYYEKTVKLSDTIKLEVYKINAYFDLINQYVVNNQGQLALDYFKEKPELKNFLLNSGYEYYFHQLYASAFTAIGRFDSAGYYFKKAEIGFETKSSKVNRHLFYIAYAEYFDKKGEPKKALEYWIKARKVAEEAKDIDLLQRVSASLDTTYQKLGDYRSAYFYKAQHQLYKDSLQKLSTEKDLMVLEVDNENKRKEKELQLAETSKRERHNIQYMGITAGIGGIFIVLVMLGIFSVSKGTIRVIGFFAFIFLFEFIILLADNEIHHWTHGEPWKILSIKIGLISILLPLHHFLEERVIHYLTSRKTLEVNAKGLFNKLSGKKETINS